MRALSDKLSEWRVRRYESRRLSGLDAHSSVALGYAWRAPNIGGVRRHLESIQNYSAFDVSLYPSNFASDLLLHKQQRKQYFKRHSTQILERHALFHSHVDPEFIRLAKKAGTMGKPWVHTYHLLYFPEDWGGELQPWQEEINRCLIEEASEADRCLAVGSWLVDYLAEEYGVSSQFVPNGVSMTVADQANPGRFLEKYGVTDFVLFVNSIAGVKNPLEFIEAARLMPEKKFVMIGTGLLEENIKTELETELPDNLVPLGPLPHAETLDAIAACSAFVMTSKREGLPTVLLEAMILERPCVVPNSPWFADAIQSDEYGLRYELGNYEDLISRIIEALRMKKNPTARSHVESTFSWPVVIKQIDLIYQELLDSPKKAAG